MSTKPVIPRVRAHEDATEALRFYAEEGGEQVALRFVDALEAAYRRIGRHPSIGSPRYASEIDWPGLRHLRLRRYPFLVFYFERGDHIDVVRLLHAERDVPESLRHEDDT